MFYCVKYKLLILFFFFAFPHLVELSAQHKLVYPLPVQFEHLNSLI